MVHTSPGPLEEVDDSVNFFLQQLQIEMVHTSTGLLEEVDDSFNFFLQQLQIEMVHTSTGPLSNLDRGPLIIFCTIIILYISIVCYFLSASFGVQDPILCQSSLLAIRPCIISKYMAILIDL